MPPFFLSSPDTSSLSLSSGCVYLLVLHPNSRSLQTQTNVQHPSAVALPHTRRQTFWVLPPYRLSHSFTASHHHPQHCLLRGTLAALPTLTRVTPHSLLRGTPSALNLYPPLQRCLLRGIPSTLSLLTRVTSHSLLRGTPTTHTRHTRRTLTLIALTSSPSCEEHQPFTPAILVAL